jgi:hypothetical protein
MKQLNLYTYSHYEVDPKESRTIIAPDLGLALEGTASNPQVVEFKEGWKFLKDMYESFLNKPPYFDDIIGGFCAPSSQHPTFSVQVQRVPEAQASRIVRFMQGKQSITDKLFCSLRKRIGTRKMRKDPHRLREYLGNSLREISESIAS